MKVKENKNKLEKSKEYKEWKEKNPDSYFAHEFFMVEGNEINLEIGYYNNKDSSMASFRIEPEIQLTICPEIFKKEDSKIEELEINKVKLDIDDALEKADKLQKEKYPSDSSIKKIAILQNIGKMQIWNITYITQNFKTLNIKIDAETGEILSDKLIEIIQF